MNAPTATRMTTGSSPEQRRLRRLASLQPYLYVMPAVLFVAAFLLYPMVYTVWQGFTDSNGLTAPNFVGLENYGALFGNSNFLLSLQNTLIWVVASVVLPVGLGFTMALTLERLPGAAIFKTTLYLPFTFSAAAAGILFTFVFDPGNGVLNVLFRAVGLTQLGSTRWLFDSPLNTFSMIAAYTWQSTGINLMIFLIGLQSLPKEPLEAAKIDGAAGWNFTRLITVPMMRPFVTIAAISAAINGFKAFDIIWVMTQGGPGRSSETLAVTMYREGFILFHQGYSSAIAVIISLIALVFSYLYLRNILDRESHA
jgi:ABC-type sugar transport system permease subunit